MLAAMSKTRKRPLGITLMALMFFWIGGIGTVVFPIMLFADAFGSYREIVNSFIKPEWLALCLLVLFLVIWWAMYILYAFLGVAFWKLREWGRKTFLIVLTAFTWLFLVGEAIWVRPFTLLFSVAIFSVGINGLFIWYLTRRNVLVAFGKIPPSVNEVEDVRPKSKYRWLKVLAVAACLFLAFALGLTVTAEQMFRHSAVVRTAFGRANLAPCVKEQLGEPVRLGWMITGNMSESNESGEADLEVPIKGPKGKGHISLIAKKESSRWSYQSLSFYLDDESNPYEWDISSSGMPSCSPHK